MKKALFIMIFFVLFLSSSCASPSYYGRSQYGYRPNIYVSDFDPFGQYFQGLTQQLNQKINDENYQYYKKGREKGRKLFGN